MLGLPTEGLLLGEPQDTRSDEWMVLTPYFQIAINNGLGTINELSPYRESLRSFQALPILDWGMLFKPQHWGFLALPAANAFSLYFLLMTLSFVGGWSLFFTALRMPTLPSVLLAATLYLAPMTQVWWTTNAGVFAFAPWCMLAWISIRRPTVRIIACTYALAVWMISCAYPPFLHAIGFAMLALVVCFRPDTLGWRLILDGMVATVLGLLIFVAYFGELIDIMQATVYPGQRISSSGGLEWPKLFAHLFPTLTTLIFEPLPAITNSNAAEVSVLSSLLPTYALALANHGRILRLIRQHPWQTALLGLFMLFITAWLVLYIPPFIAKATGLFMVPAGRAVLAFGLLVNVISALALCRGGIRITRLRLIALLLITLLGTLAKLSLGHDGMYGLYSPLDAIPYLCFLVLLAWVWRTRAADARTLSGILFAAFLGNALSHGAFNPVQSAYPIFEADKNAIRQHLANLGSVVTPDGALAVPGHFGAILQGQGFSTINHVLYHPQSAYFKRHFPDLPADIFNSIFNRYAHVSMGHVATPTLIAPDHIQLPLSAFSGVLFANSSQYMSSSALQTEISEHRLSGATPLHGHIDRISTTSPSHVKLEGWIHASDAPRIQLWSNNPVRKAQAASLPRPDVAEAISARLKNSGLRLIVEFERDLSPGDELCLVVREENGHLSSVRFPDGRQGCTPLQQAQPASISAPVP